MADKARIGLLGGTFDPLHNGHLAVARAVREQLGLEQVLLIPASRPPHKLHHPITPFALRAAMIQAAVLGDPALGLSLIEAETLGPSFSIDTLERLAPTFGHHPPYFIIGADAFSDIASWKRFRDLPALAHLVVVNRDHETAAQLPEEIIARYFVGFQATGEGRWLSPDHEEILMVSMPRVAISSTRIRELVRQGEEITRLVPEAVAEAIARYGLYQGR
jgi:nicotinate-nucleotide adenylyltransferase